MSVKPGFKDLPGEVRGNVTIDRESLKTGNMSLYVVCRTGICIKEIKTYICMTEDCIDVLLIPYISFVN